MSGIKDRKKEVDNLLSLNFWSCAEEPKDCFLFIAAVAAGIDPDCRQFSTLAPALDRQRGNSQDFGNFFDS